MMLNRDEIVKRGLIVEGYDLQSQRDAGYDLRIQTLIGKGAKDQIELAVQSYDLAPQGIAAVVSREVVKLPPDICAYASVKTSLCREGVLAINIGVIDPGWEGPISSLLLNFGKDSYQLRSNQAFLRLTFHTITAPDNVKSVVKDRTSYEGEVMRGFEARLASTFMDFDKAAKASSKKYVDEMKNALLKYIPIGALMLAGLTFFMNFGIVSLASRAMPMDVVQLRAAALTEPIKQKADKLSEEVDQLSRENSDLKKTLDTANEKIAALERATKKH
jgi:deoxycytidine triphosphate deaminase